MDGSTSRFWGGFWAFGIGLLIAYVLWLEAGDRAEQPVPTPTVSSTEAR